MAHESGSHCDAPAWTGSHLGDVFTQQQLGSEPALRVSSLSFSSFLSSLLSLPSLSLPLPLPPSPSAHTDTHSQTHPGFQRAPGDLLSDEASLCTESFCRHSWAPRHSLSAYAEILALLPCAGIGTFQGRQVPATLLSHRCLFREAEYCHSVLTSLLVFTLASRACQLSLVKD